MSEVDSGDGIFKTDRQRPRPCCELEDPGRSVDRGRAFQPVSLNRVVRDVVGLLRPGLPRTITVHTKLSREVNTTGDPLQIQHALFNLCLNARYAMPQGGELLLQTDIGELLGDRAEKLSLAPGRYCMLTVRAAGQGVLDDSLLVFDPLLSSADREPTGSPDLARVLDTVQAHNGGIQLFSEPGQGTEVTLYLPATDRTPAPRHRPPLVHQTPPGQGETLLLVDDEKVLRQMAHWLLRGLGYSVLLASSGEEAVEIYRKSSDRISLVILDVVLSGISGAETLDRLRQINPAVKVLASSGFRQDEEPRRLIEKGVDGFLQKPWGMEEIGRAIREILGGDPRVSGQ